MTAQSAGRALDPAVEQILARVGPSLHADLERLPPEQALALARPVMPVAPPPADSRDLLIPGPEGSTLPLRLYGEADDAGARPALLYLHGGGFVAGTIGMDDRRCAQLARDTGCIVASLEYRLAPEFPFPAAIEDTCAAWAYLHDHTQALGIDAERCGVSGSSAGGHLATGLCLTARSRGLPEPRFLILTNPALDPGLSTPSYTEFAQGPFLTRARMAWYWKQYGGATVGTAAGAGTGAESTWNPMKADLSAFPPSLVITAELDVLRDEGEAFARRLAAAGVDVVTDRRPGMIHGFISVLPDHAETQAAMQAMASFMRKHA